MELLFKKGAGGTLSASVSSLPVPITPAGVRGETPQSQEIVERVYHFFFHTFAYLFPYLLLPSLGAELTDVAQVVAVRPRTMESRAVRSVSFLHAFFHTCFHTSVPYLFPYLFLDVSVSIPYSNPQQYIYIYIYIIYISFPKKSLL